MGGRVNFGGMGIGAVEWHARLRTRLDKGEPGECWPWEGTMRVDNSHPTHTHYPAMGIGGIVGNRVATAVNVRQLMRWLGDSTYTGGPVELVCGDARCCNPDHMASGVAVVDHVPYYAPGPVHNAPVIVHPHVQPVHEAEHWALPGLKWFDKAAVEEATMTDVTKTDAEVEDERMQYELLQGRVKLLDDYFTQSGITGPDAVQMSLIWAAMMLRDQADMPELGHACFETAKAATQLYVARMEVAVGAAAVPTEPN